MNILDNTYQLSESQVTESENEIAIKLLMEHLFEAINQRETDYLLDINAKIAQYLSDKLYQRIFAYIAKCLTPQEKDWLYTNLTNQV